MERNRGKNDGDDEDEDDDWFGCGCGWCGWCWWCWWWWPWWSWWSWWSWSCSSCCCCCRCVEERCDMIMIWFSKARRDQMITTLSPSGGANANVGNNGQHRHWTLKSWSWTCHFSNHWGSSFWEDRSGSSTSEKSKKCTQIRKLCHQFQWFRCTNWSRTDADLNCTQFSRRSERFILLVSFSGCRQLPFCLQPVQTLDWLDRVFPQQLLGCWEPGAVPNGGLNFKLYHNYNSISIPRPIGFLFEIDRNRSCWYI